MVTQKDGRVQAFAMQIVKILKFLKLELGEGEPLPPNNILNSESMSEKTNKPVKPKSSRTKSSKGTSSSAPAEESSKPEKPKKKAVEAEASQEKKGRKKSSAKKIFSKPADSEKTLSSDKSPKRTGDVFQPIPINTVRPISVDSQSPSKNIDEVIADIGLNTSEIIVGVVQNIARETEDDVSSCLKSADQGEIPDQSEIQPVEETAKTENITPPAQEGNSEKQEPSGSAGNKSNPKDTTTQSA
ncbi:protein DEK-like [Impatiens glandulifera]|uniref:protein DEK-like n=1 Tax=Impatiens glandulifera TaxID=253017 RepID=UPI001FB13159|nr:protein DEK-like [Impatiens glandulifera]